MIVRKARRIITVILIKLTDASKTSGTEYTGSNHCMLKVIIILDSEKGYVEGIDLNVVRFKFFTHKTQPTVNKLKTLQSELFEIYVSVDEQTVVFLMFK